MVFHNHAGITLHSVAKTCKKFFRYIYDVNKAVDHQLIEQLSGLGELHINAFSKYSSVALDHFSIKGQEEEEISGALGGYSIYLVLSKQRAEDIKKFETILLNWIDCNEV